MIQSLVCIENQIVHLMKSLMFKLLYKFGYFQRAKKDVSDSPGLVDFSIGLVIFVLNLPDGQVLFFGKIKITEGL